MVNGIEDESSISIKRRKKLVKVKAFTKKWWLKTNNGRAFILMMACLLAWIISFMVLTSSEPIINAGLFNTSDGLSQAEKLYNESAAIVSPELLIPQDKASSAAGILTVWGWLIIVSILVLIYSVLSLREEIAAGFEEGVEKLFDKSYAKSGDPWFEKIAKFAGSYSVSRKAAEATVSNPVATAAPAAAPNKNPSLSTLFKLDLIGGLVGAVIPAMIKKIF